LAGMEFELSAQGLGVTAIEAVFGELLFFRQADVTVGFAFDPANVVDAFDVLQEGADALEAIGDLDGDGVEVDTAALLEVGELGDLQAVEKDLPANAPGPKGRGFPIVLFKANVVLAEIDADGFEAAEIDGLNVGRRRLEDDLILKVLVEAVGIFTVAAVSGAARWLDVGDAIGRGAEDTEEGFRVHGAGTDFGVVGLLEDAGLASPELHELEDEILKG
jgi:hypothetical protein